MDPRGLLIEVSCCTSRFLRNTWADAALQSWHPIVSIAVRNRTFAAADSAAAAPGACDSAPWAGRRGRMYVDTPFICAQLRAQGSYGTNPPINYVTPPEPVSPETPVRPDLGALLKKQKNNRSCWLTGGPGACLEPADTSAIPRSARHPRPIARRGDAPAVAWAHR